MSKLFTSKHLKTALALAVVYGLRKYIFAAMMMPAIEFGKGGGSAGLGALSRQQYYNWYYTVYLPWLQRSRSYAGSPVEPQTGAPLLSGYELYMHRIVSNAMQNGTLRQVGCTGQVFGSTASPLRACYFERLDTPGTTLRFTDAFRSVTGGTVQTQPSDQAACQAKGGQWIYAQSYPPTYSCRMPQTRRSACESYGGQWVPANVYPQDDNQGYCTQRGSVQSGQAACQAQNGNWVAYDAYGRGECLPRQDVFTMVG